jgi:predicted naringenin-chalcone synthase
LGIGTATPPYQILQAQSLEIARHFLCGDDQSLRSLPALYRMTRVASRGSVLLENPEQDLSSPSDSMDGSEGVTQSFYAPAFDSDFRGPTTTERMERFRVDARELANAAAKVAISDAQLSPHELTHLVTVTCTGFSAPGFDIDLIEQLGLDLEIERVQVGFMGCHAIINATRVARALVSADPHAKVLVVAVELCSLHYQYGWESDRLVANALFADGCGAMIFGSADTHRTDAPHVLATGSLFIPNTKEAMSWNIGNHGFEMTLSSMVPGIIQEHLSPFLQRWVSNQIEGLSHVRGWAVHPGGPRVLGAVQEALNLPVEALQTSRNVLHQHGNMSSATLVFILEQMINAGVPKPWLMLGFGPGLEIEVALIG